jgi:hypothetical protein
MCCRLSVFKREINQIWEMNTEPGDLRRPQKSLDLQTPEVPWSAMPLPLPTLALWSLSCMELCLFRRLLCGRYPAWNYSVSFAFICRRHQRARPHQARPVVVPFSLCTHLLFLKVYKTLNINKSFRLSY